MPLTTGEKRGFIVFGVGLLLLMTLVAWLNSDNKDEEGSPSSYSAQRGGAKAAYLLLQQSGYPVERWNKPPDQLPADETDATLVLAGPETYPDSQEFVAINRFLLRGGRVLITGTFLPYRFVPQSSVEYKDQRVGFAESKPVAPTHLTRGGPISQNGMLSWDYANDTAVVHFKDDKHRPVVVSYPVGQGQVIWWASSLPLTNAGIRDRGNLDLLLNSVADSKHILWDEYYHNLHEERLGYHGNPAASWAWAQIGFLGLLVILTYSRRSGPLVPLAREPRLSPLEFVETLGSVFHRARGTQVAIEIALNRFQQIAARRLGIRGSSTATEIVQAMTQRGLKLPENTATLVRISEDAAGDPELSEKRALDHVKALNQATQLLDPSATPASAPSAKERKS